MPEVIDLLSTPINTPPKVKPTTVRQAQAEPPSANIFDIGSDDFNFSSFSDGLDFPTTQAKKKRRLSPPDSKLIDKTTTVTTTTCVEELPSDPITFSSSAPEPRTIRRAAKSIVIDLEAEDVGNQNMFSLSQPSIPKRAPLSDQTANLLVNIRRPEKGDAKYKPVAQTIKSKTTASTTASLKTTKRSIAEDDIFTSSPPNPRARPLKTSAKDKDVRDADKAATRARKAEEKEAEKERKRLAKEEKSREKQLAADLAEINRSKTDKKNSTPEMIVDMVRSLEGTSVGNQVLEYMEVLGVEATFFDDQSELSGSTEVAKKGGNLVRWRRKIRAKYNEEVGHWEPIPIEKVELEKHILVHITAQEFLEIAALELPLHEEPAAREKAMTRNLDMHVASLRSRYKDCKPIYLIEGLSTFLRKNKNAKNRAYTAAVRSQMANNNQSIPPTSNQPRRKKNANPVTTSTDLSFITEDLVETLLLHLQLHPTKILIHQSATPSLSATWIKSFTEHISTIPYRHLRMTANDAVCFCMDVGQVKTGDDRLDTYVKMLQEVQRVTPAMAYGIANQYGTVGELVRAFREEGPLCLQGIRKGVNRDGGVSEAVLGKMVSRRLAKVWLGRDPGSMDGVA